MTLRQPEWRMGHAATALWVQVASLWRAQEVRSGLARLEGPRLVVLAVVYLFVSDVLHKPWIG